MKKKLLEKLSSPEVDRKFKWYWSNYIRPHHGITYQHFMTMLDGSAKMRDDVKESIEAYLGENGD